jgi:hypothetical protein
MELTPRVGGLALFFNAMVLTLARTATAESIRRVMTTFIFVPVCFPDLARSTPL